MNKTRERRIIERSIIFSITLIGVIFFMIFDFGFVYTYRLDGYNDWQWFAFWTHLSNMAAFTWISLALIAVLTRNQGLEHWLQHWNIKNTVFTFIITTGLIFIFVAYFPVVIFYAKQGPIAELEEFVRQVAIDGELKYQVFNDVITNNAIEAGVNPVTIDSILNQITIEVVNTLLDMGQTEFEMANGRMIDTDPSAAYRSCVILGTTFKHVIIPSMFGYLAVTELGYYRTKNISDTERSMIQFIWPCLYLVYAITLASVGLIMPPYPVLDFGFTYSFYEMTPMWQCLYILLCAILDILVGVIFVFTSLLQNKWSQKKFSEDQIILYEK